MSNRVEAFKERLASLEEKTGFVFKMECDSFDQALADNRLSVNWFDGGTLMASVKDGKAKAEYSIEGDFYASLFSPEGDLMTIFEKHLRPLDGSKGLPVMMNDKDVAALVDGTHPSGCTLDIKNRNVMRVYAPSMNLDQITVLEDSAAKIILDEKIASEIIARIYDAHDEKGAADSFVDESDILPFDNDPVLPAENAEDSDEWPSGISDYAEDFPEEPADEEAPAEPEKPEKKTKKAKSTKGTKTSAARKKAAEPVPEPEDKAVPEEPAVKAAPASDACSMSGRFDLLPLDVIGMLIDKFEVNDNINFLADIEAFKASNDGLADAAISFAGMYFPDAVSATMAVAGIAEADALENGEDSWKEKDVKDFINGAVMHYLLFLRDGDDGRHLAEVLWNLVCGIKVRSV